MRQLRMTRCRLCGTPYRLPAYQQPGKCPRCAAKEIKIPKFVGRKL